MKTDVRDAGPREFFFSSEAAPCAPPPEDVAAEDVSTISKLRRKTRGRRRRCALALLFSFGVGSFFRMETSPSSPNEVSKRKSRKSVFFSPPLSAPKRASPRVYGARKLRCDLTLGLARGTARGERAHGVEARTRCPTLLAPPLPPRTMQEKRERDKSFSPSFGLAAPAARCPCTPRERRGKDDRAFEQEKRSGGCFAFKSRKRHGGACLFGDDGKKERRSDFFFSLSSVLLQEKKSPLRASSLFASSSLSLDREGFFFFFVPTPPSPRIQIMGKAKEALPGLSSAGRSKSYHRRGLWAIKKKNGGKLPVHPKKAAKAAVEAKVRREMQKKRTPAFAYQTRRDSV